MLTDEQKKRYDRNIRLRDFGIEGQIKLLKSRVLVIGAGGLGSPVILYLAAAGVGTITIADNDQITLSNLQRQILFRTSDQGAGKAELAAIQANLLNPDVRAAAFVDRITEDNLPDLIRKHDMLVDCTDNVVTKFLINDLCVKASMPFSHGGVVGMAGQVMTYTPGHACIRCAFEVPDPHTIPTSTTSGILGAAAGTFGALQAAEIIKYLSGAGTLIQDQFLRVDLHACSWEKISVTRDIHCICNKQY